ncbi:MAG TPA: AMP-binding protein [Xanthobacteraceae bacterium]|jgi:long-chain acyl-CoA synthetase
MNLALWLERAGKAYPERAAVAVGERVALTYSALAGRIARIAGALRGRLGLEAGDRVAIIAKNSVGFLETLYAVWHAGLVAVPVNAKLHPAELAYILEHAGARACLASPGLDADIAACAPGTLEHLITLGGTDYERLAQADAIAPTPRAADDLAWLFYTSGTTGRPKGAMLTHRVLYWTSHAYATEVNPLVPGDAILHGAPMSHGSGLYLMAHVARLGLQIIPESGGFDAEEILRLIDRRPRVSMFAAPTMVKRLVDCRYECNPENIQAIVWGGAPMYVEDIRKAVDRFGPRFSQIYGQGEAPMTISTLSMQDIADRDHPRWSGRLASAGRPFACVDVVIADTQDRPCATGESGEILCRGDVVMTGYWRDDDATASTLKGGWLHTGDIGAFDPAGFLFLKDRSKDLIISGGSNIYPREVEEVLLQHAGVQEASVIGRPDPEWGEIVVAYVVGTASRDELDTLCLQKIARFKRPKEYVFVAELPKNNYGKILKKDLRDVDAQRCSTSADPRPDGTKVA